MEKRDFDTLLDTRQSHDAEAAIGDFMEDLICNQKQR